jgi:hypothetical protein
VGLGVNQRKENTMQSWINTNRRFTYPNFASKGIENEGLPEYAKRSGQIVRVVEEVPNAFEDGDGNQCRGYRIQADDGWTGLVWPGELLEINDKR